MDAERVIAIYHKDCIDGTASAAVLLRKYPHAKTYPLQYAHSPQELTSIIEAVKPGTHVYTVDCAFGAKEFLEAGYHVTTIDHHIGAQETLYSLANTEQNYTFVFDNDKSGASLSWIYFFPDEPIPEVIKFVEDLDLWNWQYGDETREINLYLSLLLNKPQTFIPLFKKLPATVREKGAVLSRYTSIIVARLVANTRTNIALVGDYLVPFYNITNFSSECGNILSEQRDAAVALYSIDGDIVRLEFRSKEHHRPNSLELATLLKGGGHKNAAGAIVALKDFIEMLRLD